MPEHLLASQDGVTVVQTEPWLPATLTGPDPAPVVHQDPLPLAQVLPIATLSMPGERQDPDRICERLVQAAAILMLECFAGRRPMTHLTGACTESALSRVRRWPKGPGWSRVTLTGRPRVAKQGHRVEGVVMLEVAGRKVALAMTMERNSRRWQIATVGLLLNRGLTDFLVRGASPARVG